jgi:hypothetical protein
MKRLLCLVVLACFVMLSTTSGVFALNHPYQWEKPSVDNESHPWGGEDNATGGPIKSNDNDYRTYTENWAVDLIINAIISNWSQPYRPHRSLFETRTTQTETPTTQPATTTTTNRGN